MTIINNHKPSIFYEKDAADKIVEKISGQNVLSFDPTSSLDMISKFLDLSNQSVSPGGDYGIEIYLKNSSGNIIAPIAAISKHVSGSITASSNLIFPLETGKVTISSNKIITHVLDLTLAVAKDPARGYYPVSNKIYMTYINLYFELNAQGVMNFDIKQVGALYSDLLHATSTEQISKKVISNGRC